MVLHGNAYLNIGNGRFYSHFKMPSIKGFINCFFRFEKEIPLAL